MGQRSGNSHLTFILVSRPQKYAQRPASPEVFCGRKKLRLRYVWGAELLPAFDCKLQKSTLLI